MKSYPPAWGGKTRQNGNCARCRRSRGFSLLELLLVIALIAVLLSSLVYVAVGLRRSAGGSACLANLVAIQKAITAYAQANQGRFPDLAGEKSIESVLKPYLGGGSSAFACPADGEVFPSLGSSYDWRDTGDASTTLAGRMTTEARPDAVLVFDALPNWHAKGTMNAVLVNGSAMTMDEQQCIGDLRRSPVP